MQVRELRPNRKVACESVSSFSQPNPTVSVFSYDFSLKKDFLEKANEEIGDDAMEIRLLIESESFSIDWGVLRDLVDMESEYPFFSLFVSREGRVYLHRKDGKVKEFPSNLEFVKKVFA